MRKGGLGEGKCVPAGSRAACSCTSAPRVFNSRLYWNRMVESLEAAAGQVQVTGVQTKQGRWDCIQWSL